MHSSEWCSVFIRRRGILTMKRILSILFFLLATILAGSIWVGVRLLQPSTLAISPGRTEKPALGRNYLPALELATVWTGNVRTTAWR